MADRQKVLKGLECCINSWMNSCDHECPYYKKECFSAEMALMHPVMRDALELLKEPPKIVRCKDCKHGAYVAQEGMLSFVTCGGEDRELDWFCADGEVKSDE